MPSAARSLPPSRQMVLQASFKNLLDPTRLVALSDLMTLGVPRRLVNRLNALRYPFVDRSLQSSMWIALVTVQTKIAMYTFNVGAFLEWEDRMENGPAKSVPVLSNTWAGRIRSAGSGPMIGRLVLALSLLHVTQRLMCFFVCWKSAGIA